MTFPCIVVDTETTGLPGKPPGWEPRIVEVGAVVVTADLQVVADLGFQVLIKQPADHLRDPRAVGAWGLSDLTPEKVLDDRQRGRIEVPLPSLSRPVTRCAVVAAAVLGEPTQSSLSGWAAPGRWHWPLRDVQVLPRPVRVRGRQGLWALHGADEAQVLDQVRGAA